MSQVLVVVALAVVLEARSIAKSWDASVAAWWRFLQGVIWAAPLVLIAFVLPKTLRATRPGALVSISLDTWCENLLSASLGIVVLGPALELLRRGSAAPVAVLLTLGFRRRWQLRRLEREVRVTRRSLVKLLDSAARIEAESAQDRTKATALRTQVEQALAGDLNADEQQAVRTYLEELERWIAKNDGWLANSPVRTGPDILHELEVKNEEITALRELVRQARMQRRAFWAAALGSHNDS